MGRLLDGTIFDSSVRRGEPFEFVLGAGDDEEGREGCADMPPREFRTRANSETERCAYP